MNKKPLIPQDRGQIIAAVITGIISLLLYYFNQIHQIDARLDKLEREADIILDKDGFIRPSKQALDAYYNQKILEERLKLHEQKGH